MAENIMRTIYEKVQLDESVVPVPQSHIEELNRRFERYESAPENFLSLEELWIRIEKSK